LTSARAASTMEIYAKLEKKSEFPKSDCILCVVNITTNITNKQNERETKITEANAENQSKEALHDF
jgi:hypothetical protein